LSTIRTGSAVFGFQPFDGGSRELTPVSSPGVVIGHGCRLLPEYGGNRTRITAGFGEPGADHVPQPVKTQPRLDLAGIH
jgi:hypothetical protein